MGSKGLRTLIKKRYRQAVSFNKLKANKEKNGIRKVVLDSPPESPLNCDKLYVDFNWILHMLSEKTVKYVPDDVNIEFNQALDFLDILVESVSPKKMLYISLGNNLPMLKDDFFCMCY